MDNEFEPLRGELAGIAVQLDHTGADDHVGDIERWIRTVKERMRTIITSLPYLRLPPRLIIECAKSCVFWLNVFPHADGVSSTMSPREIVTGQALDFNRHCRFEFGEYVQTHEAHDNSMAPRTVGALALRPTGNAQGSYYFFSLKSSLLLNRTYATKLPMPAEVIDRVHALARRQRSQLGLIFGDRNNALPDEDSDSDDDDDSTFHPDDDADSTIAADDIVELGPPFLQGPIPAVDHETENDEIDNDNVENETDNDEADNEIADNDNETDDVDNMGHDNEAGNEIADNDNETDDVDNMGHDNELEEHDNGLEDGHDQDEMTNKYGPRTSQYDLRPRKPRVFTPIYHKRK
jgi:hypothetical protein